MSGMKGKMTGQGYFDLKMARGLLPWLKIKLIEIEDLSRKGKTAMTDLDLDFAESLTFKIQELLSEIQLKGIEIKDPSMTLFDFPAIINNMPAYLCWKSDENDITFWHYVDEGFAGRKSITGKENILGYL